MRPTKLPLAITTLVTTIYALLFQKLQPQPRRLKLIMTGGLGNQAMLAKIDRLRELSVGSMIPLPQVRLA